MLQLGPTAESFVRRAYGGGITDVICRFSNAKSHELFKDNEIIKNEPYAQVHSIRHYDIISSYPAAMYYNTFGLGYPEFRQGLQYIDGKLMKGIYECDVVVPDGLDLIYAVCDGKVSQITGKSRIYATNDELDFFTGIGIKVEKAYTSLVFSHEGSPFKDYIGSFFKMKSEASKKDPKRQIAKLFLNSLYLSLIHI